jgi:CHAT domain-containing protein/tetratricopeptide (TPR) repeat protein
MLSGLPEERVMVRLSWLGMVLAIAVLSPVLVPEGAIAMQPGTVAQAVGERQAEADRLLAQSQELEAISEYEAALKAGEKALVIYQKIGDRNGEASALNMIGVIYRSLSPYDKAIDYSQRALAIFREVKNRNGEAEALHNLAWVYDIYEEKHQAEKFVHQALQIFIEINNQKGEAGALVTLGVSHMKFNRENEANKSFKKALLLSQAIKDHDTESEALIGLGNLTRALSKEDGAIQFYKQSLSITQVTKNRVLEALALRGLGLVSQNSARYEESIRYLEQSLSIYRQIKDPRGEANSLGSLGSNKAKSGKLEEGIRDIQAARLILAKIKLHHRETLAIGLIADTYLNGNQLDKAEEYYSLGAKVARQHGLEKVEFRLLFMIFSIHDEQRTSNALPIEMYNRYVELAAKVSPEAEAEALITLSRRFYWRDFDLTKVIITLQQSLNKIENLNVSEEQPLRQQNIIQIRQKILGQLVSAFGTIGEYEQAASTAKERLKILRTLEIRGYFGEINTLMQIAKIHTVKQEWQMSASTLQDARLLIQHIKEIRKDDKVAAETFIAMAFVDLYAQKGDSEKALEEARKAISFANNSDRLLLRLDALDSLRIANEQQNNLPETLKTLNQILELSRQLPSDFDRAMALGRLGQFYLDLGDYDTGRKIVEEAKLEAQKGEIFIVQLLATMLLAHQDILKGNPKTALKLEKIFEQQPDNPRIRQFGYWVISQGYGELGNYEKSLDAAQKSLALTQKTKDQWGVRSVLILIGDLHRKFGRHQEAISSYNEALASLDKRQNLSTNNQLVKIYAGLAKTHVALNQPTVAISFYKQAINNVEKSRTSLRELSPNLQQSFLQSTIGFGKVKTADIYRELADLLLSQGNILEAQQILELLQIEELKDANQPLRSNRKPPETTLSPLQKELIQRHGSLIAFGYDLDKCRTEKCDRFTTLDEQFRQLQLEFNEFLQKFDTDIRKSNGADRAAIDPTKLGKAQTLINATQTKTKQNTVLIYTLILDQRLWLVWVSSSGVKKSEPIPVTQIQLAKTVLTFRELMGECEKRTCTAQDTAKFQTVSSQLYDWLIRPIEPELTQNNIKNLIFSLDRTVRYIPMGALYDNQQKQYLTQKYAISTVLSAELTHPYDRAPFSRDQTQVLALGTSQAFLPNFSRLDYVPLETRTIVRRPASKSPAIFPGNEWLNDKFNAATLRNEIEKPQYRIAHLATHGKFIPGNPRASFLLTGDGKEFTIAAIQTLRSLNHLDLIVLSACESALGGSETPNKLDGIEISSMSYHFLNQQAKSVLASLWKVSDPSTALFMQRFYTHLANGKTKAQAIQQVQKDFITGKLTPTEAATLRAEISASTDTPAIAPGPASPPDYTHPFYWAPFILIGNNL